MLLPCLPLRFLSAYMLSCLLHNLRILVCFSVHFLPAYPAAVPAPSILLLRYPSFSVHLCRMVVAQVLCLLFVHLIAYFHDCLSHCFTSCAFHCASVCIYMPIRSLLSNLRISGSAFQAFHYFTSVSGCSTCNSSILLLKYPFTLRSLHAVRRSSCGPFVCSFVHPYSLLVIVATRLYLCAFHCAFRLLCYSALLHNLSYLGLFPSVSSLLAYPFCSTCTLPILPVRYPFTFRSLSRCGR